MRIEGIHSVFLIGIGGIGMSALARYFHRQGAQVRGYDKTPSPITEALAEEGIVVFFTDELSNYPSDVDLVIYTPAIPADHLGLNWYKEQGFNIYKRSEVLEQITREKETIAVAGTHGKTSITALIAHVLNASDTPTSAFIGGVANNFHSNFVYRESDRVVVEADEFDRSFLRLHPHIAVISALDPDHLDIYGSLEELTANFYAFTKQVDPSGYLIVQAQLPLLQKVDHPRVFTYGIETAADVIAHKVRVEDGHFTFDLEIQGDEYGTFQLSFPGYHNVENALAAITVGYVLSADMEKMRAALASFSGIRRRFEKIWTSDEVVYIDDYAHHPREIEALLKSVRTLYPNRHITAIFQPHLYSRTRDLVEGFAESLSLANEVLLLPIYPAREIPLPGVESDMIATRMKDTPVEVIEKSAIVDTLSKRSLEVLLTIGAGDIDRLVAPIREHLQKQSAA